MKLSKKIILSLAALSLTTAVFADDWGYDEEESAEPTVTIGGKVEMNARAYVEASESSFNTTTGEIDYADRPDLKDVTTAVFPTGKLYFNYSGLSSDVSMTVKLDKTSLYDGYYWDILDEFTARAYVGNAQFEAGKMRVVWGKGDKLHVVDNFNANDYTDYIIPDYIDRRISEPMFRAVYSTNNNIKFEGIFTPMMTPDRLASGGVWQPKASKKLTATVTDFVLETAVTAIAANDWTTALGCLSFDANSLYPNTQTLEYSQAGARMTFTVGGLDLGVSYYYGHNKQPSANTSALINGKAASTMSATIAGLDATTKTKLGITPAAEAAANTILARYVAATSTPELDYDMVQVFGLEGAGILFGRLNSRFEVAYNLTKDIAGDDPWVHNNSIGWVAGFDIDLPIHNINLNVQNNGKYIMNNDKIGEASFRPFDNTALNKFSTLLNYSYEEYDVDYDPTGCYTNNKIVVDITDTWNHEKIKLDLKGIYGIERGDLLVMPTLTFIVKDDFSLNLSGLYIWCKDSDSEFDGWERNSFAQIGVKYQF